MQPDDELCLCFHVTRRKVEQFIEVERPRRMSELSQCYGAGTGCGWCRPFLQRLFESQERRTDVGEQPRFPNAADYAENRAAYRRKADANRD